MRDEILAAWTADAPGTRPSFWWKFDAPRQPLGTFPGCFWDGKLPEPRRRLGGIGTPSHECLAYKPHYDYGLPAHWVKKWESDYYNSEGDFEGVAIDPENPPKYESEAAYLERHALFLPGEKKRLQKADFEPELITPADEDETEVEDDAA